MRISRSIVFSASALGILLIAWPAHSQDVTVADVGRGFFQQYCSGCHGPEGKGDSPFAAYLKVPPPDLTMISKRRGGTFPETEVAEIIEGRRVLAGHGSREMPSWGLRFGETAPESPAKQASARGQVVVLVAYLRSIQQK